MDSHSLALDMLFVIIGLVIFYMAVRAASHAWYAGKLKHHNKILKSITEPKEK